MIYDIKLVIDYDYANAATGGRHLACLLPLSHDADQRLISGALTITPVPEERTDRRDFFGNSITEFSFRGAHSGIAVMLSARVERFEPLPGPADATRLADLPAALSQIHSLAPDSPLHFLSASPRVPPTAEITAFARARVRPDMTLAEILQTIGHALHGHMRFDPEATTVDTPIAEAFAARHGVCQDFSHIMIAALRGLGIPAGYVSGFLRTLPPPGKPRLEGADAMHAWVRAWCGPTAGWIEFDPTNDKGAGTDHIVVARGRDYSDVVPIKGTLRISGGQESHQAVDVIPVES